MLKTIIFLITAFSISVSADGPSCSSLFLNDLPIELPFGLKNLANKFEVLLDEADPNARDAWYAYQGHYYEFINHLLRSANPDFSKQDISEIRYTPLVDKGDKNPLRTVKLASYLEKAFLYGFRLKKGTQLFRGVALLSEKVPQVGQILYDNAFLSTTNKKNWPKNFINNALEFINEVDRPKYKKVIFHLNSTNENTKVIVGTAGEGEVIFPRHTRLRVKSVVDNGDFITIIADIL